MKWLLALYFACFWVTVNVAAEEISFPSKSNIDWSQHPQHKNYGPQSAPFKLFEKIAEIADTESKLIDRFGQPEKRISRFVKSRHEPDYQVEFITLKYDGLIIELQKNHQGKTLFSRLFINNCEVLSDFTSLLCNSKNNLKAQLGKPNIVTDNELIYLLQFGDLGATPLRIETHNGVAYSIYFINFID